MTNRIPSVSLSWVSCLLLFSANLSAADWPQWRGPSRDSLSQDQLPESIGEKTLTKTWSVTLGPSYSGPIVVGDRVFTTETVDKKTEVVRAWNRKTGEQLWMAEWEGALSVPFFAASNGSWIRATPACDGESLYVAGMRDLLVCLDMATGQVRWKQDLKAHFDAPLPAFGFVCSPLIVEDAIYVQAGGGFVKLNKRTGEVIWRTLEDGGGMNGSAFSSPILTEFQGVKQFVVQTREYLAGVEMASGEILWKQEVPAFRGMNILTPVIYDGAIFTSSYGGASYLYRPVNSGSGWKVQEVWKNKVQGYMSTPVLIDGHVYLHLKNQRFTCIDLKTGEQPWTSTPFGKYWSMVSHGNKILALDEQGDLLLIEASPTELKVLEKRHVTDEPAWAHLALSENQIFIRSLNELTVYEFPSAVTKSQAAMR